MELTTGIIACWIFAVGVLLGCLLGKKLARLKSSDAQNFTMRCCKCGKRYEPLNDPDHIPELNICRDCLWKLHYDTMFDGKEDL